MKTLAMVVLLTAAFFGSAAAEAQTPVRMRGIISAFDGKQITVKADDGKTVDIQLTEKTVVVFTQPIAFADIKAGDFLAVTSTRRSDGTLTAAEVRRFPKPSNPGHRPLSGGRDDQTMTNATVASIVQSSNGRDVTLSYEGGSQKITVPEAASISMLVPGERSQLLPNAPVNVLTTPSSEGKPIARHIQVGPPAVKPPQ